jgi:hypothetical protein
MLCEDCLIHFMLSVDCYAWLRTFLLEYKFWSSSELQGKRKKKGRCLNLLRLEPFTIAAAGSKRQRAPQQVTCAAGSSPDLTL